MNRRKFIKRTFYGSLSLGLIGGMYGWQIEPFWVEHVKVNMPIPNLPEHLAGKKLIQISDIHIGNRFDYNYIISALQEAQKLNPDFVVYTGDFISYHNSKQFNQLNEVAQHFTKGKLGTLAILGNHDYGVNYKEWNVAQNVSDILSNNGVTVLRNEKQELDGLHFHGLDDYWGINFNPEPTLNNIDNKQANIVLCHNPDVCDKDIWGDYNSWILSGHTHGGQVKPPFLPPPILPVNNKRYTAGKFALSNNRTLYINRALGVLWQFRFNVRPEVTIFNLQQA